MREATRNQKRADSNPVLVLPNIQRIKLILWICRKHLSLSFQLCRCRDHGFFKAPLAQPLGICFCASGAGPRRQPSQWESGGELAGAGVCSSCLRA